MPLNILEFSKKSKVMVMFLGDHAFLNIKSENLLFLCYIHIQTTSISGTKFLLSVNIIINNNCYNNILKKNTTKKYHFFFSTRALI